MSAYFDEIAGDYDAQMARLPGDVWARDAFQDFVTSGLTPGQVLLDFGCGTGIDAQVYAARGFRVIGYDPSAGMLREATRRCRAELDAGVVGLLGFPYERFLDQTWTAERPSAIASDFAVLNLVPALPALFARFREILQPGGRAYVSLLNPCHVGNLTTPGMRRALLEALLRGETDFPLAKAPTRLYRERAVRQAARPHFALERRAGVGAIVDHAAISGSWREPRGWRERLERRLFFTRAMASAGKFTFLELRRLG